MKSHPDFGGAWLFYSQNWNDIRPKLIIRYDQIKLGPTFSEFAYHGTHIFSRAMLLFYMGVIKGDLIIAHKGQHFGQLPKNPVWKRMSHTLFRKILVTIKICIDVLNVSNGF